MSDIQEAISHLLDLVESAAGGQRSLTLHAGRGRMILTRMSLLESLFGDEPPACGELEQWVVTTARNLGSDQRRARSEPTGPESIRMSIVVPLGDLEVVVEAFSSLPDTPGDELAMARNRRHHQKYLVHTGRT